MTAYWQGKVALITGGSGGLGLAIARAFAAADAHVAIAARGLEALEVAAAELRTRGAEVLAVPTDVTRQEDVDQLVAQTLARFGRLDVLVNNAGRSARKSVLDATPEEFRELLELNFIAAVRMVQASLPALEASQGHIVNVSSLAGKSPARWIGAYPASKFALTAYSQQLRLELAEPHPEKHTGASGVHVLLVCPGPVARPALRQEPHYQAAGLPDRALRPGGGRADERD